MDWRLAECCLDSRISAFPFSLRQDCASRGNPFITEVSSLTSWLFQQDTPIPEDAACLLLPTELLVAAYTTLRNSAIFTTEHFILRDVRSLWRRKMEVQSLSYSLITTWSSIHYGSVNKLDVVDRRWQDQCGQASGRPAARHADRHVRVGGVGQPETPHQVKQRTPHECPRHCAGGRR